MMANNSVSDWSSVKPRRLNSIHAAAAADRLTSQVSHPIARTYGPRTENIAADDGRTDGRPSVRVRIKLTATSPDRLSFLYFRFQSNRRIRLQDARYLTRVRRATNSDCIRSTRRLSAQKPTYVCLCLCVCSAGAKWIEVGQYGRKHREFRSLSLALSRLNQLT
jgi:hypothetical protein